MENKKLTNRELELHDLIFSKTHPKISEAMMDFLFKNSFDGGEFFYWFVAKIELIKSDTIPTAGVRFSNTKMQMLYNMKFIDKLEINEVKFLLAHEVMHLLWSHNRRGAEHGYDHRIYNIATDMLINKSITDEYTWCQFIEGGVKWDSHYKGENISDNIYHWMKELAEELKEKQESKEQTEQEKGDGDSDDSCDSGGGGGQSEGNEGQSKGGKGKPEDSDAGDKKEGESPKKERHLEGKASEQLEDMLDDYNNNPEFTGEFTDSHLADEGEISDELKAEIIKDTLKEMQNRGVVDGHMETILAEHLKESKNHFLKLLKRSIASIKGKSPLKSYMRLNRRLPGKLKGKKGVSNKINVILDISGSMYGLIDKVVSEIFKDGYEINLIPVSNSLNDQNVHVIKNKSQLKSLSLQDAYGGTQMQIGIDFIIQNKWQTFGTVLLTDGYVENLKTAEIPGMLILYKGQECPIATGNPRQIEIPDDYKN